MSTDRHPFRLLDDYTALLRQKNSESLVTTVISTRSREARRLLAHRVAEPPATLEAILAAARDEAVERELAATRRLDGDALAKLGRALVCNPLDLDDLETGWSLYEIALRHGGPESLSPRDQATHVELAMLSGKADVAERLLSEYADIDQNVRRAVGMDLARPWGGVGDERRWKALLSEIVPEPVPGHTLRGEGTMFDGLDAGDLPSVDSPDLVTVIITTFRRGLPLLTSLRSVLRQTWTNIEVLVVDDASGPEYEPVLAACEAEDDRVRVIRLDDNGGSYRARNIGLAEARGIFVAVQDSDDWWHPRHLELHLAPLRAEPELVGTISKSAVLTEDLRATRLRRAPVLPCASSLLFRREEVVARIGFWDDIRKAADNEYLGRMDAAFGKGAVRRLAEVLTLVRTGVESLSSSDYGSGWKHPARLAYHSSYHHWHERILAGKADPYVAQGARAPLFQPHRFRPGSDPQRYDVVYAGDWVNYGGPQKSMLNEIRAALGAGLRVGVMNFTPLRFARPKDRDLNPGVQELINSGAVEQVVATDEAHVRLLVLRYPPILQFPPPGRCTFTVDRLVILANQPPTEADGSDLRYLPETCEHHARELFGAEPEWVPQGPHVRHALVPFLPEDSVLHEFDMPGVLDDTRWCLPRDGFRGPVPVLGRHTRDHPMKWPGDRETLARVYPTRGPVDVRIMGGAQSAMHVLKRRRLPLNWVVFEYNEMGVREFLHQLDFYAYFPHEHRIEAFGRSILEAIASGAVTILPPHFEEVFGEGALYCEPEQVADLVDRLWADPEAFLRQSRRAQDHVRRAFGYRSYVERLGRLGIAPEPVV
ncbi:glycosyltransferase [Glycomyces sp. A-F 0318]|uniref:glycosyltransferase n=1 Tax=Glycomyces amatae TaxID=2881355 RepID=UPI001E461141|nr:glycosyltransferase [Glycomyces amatae]MCD0444353.1 glycosyltransferase [Glycomyces amatae]